MTATATRRLALCNVDWDRVAATDIFGRLGENNPVVRANEREDRLLGVTSVVLVLVFVTLIQTKLPQVICKHFWGYVSDIQLCCLFFSVVQLFQAKRRDHSLCEGIGI